MAATLAEFPTPADLDLAPPEALLTLLAKVGPISTPWSSFARSLMTEGRLQPEWRELAILRVGARKGCHYVLSGHLPMARHAGLSEERVASALGELFPEPRDIALLGAVDELLEQGRVTRETRQLLKGILSDEELIELAMLAGQYVLVSMLCETFDLRPESVRIVESH
jgi:4-carboxymuconolactone decarboxylase